MRIGQLARRLGVSPSEIIGFLAAQNIEIETESGTNARLADDVVARVVDRFAPESKSEVTETIPAIAEEEPVEQETTMVEGPPLESEPVEVIRVSKVELQGLKVLGKIDLPEPKKKPEPETPDTPKREYQPRQSQPRRDWKNPIETKRQQETREAERKKKEQAEREKEKRTNHYYNKVKSVPTKPAKKIEEDLVVEDLTEKEPPKTLVGKVWRWLTS